ncbi:MAG: hypothetical protein ACOCXT_01540 [Candidatus Dojkabacteria bacterium]
MMRYTNDERVERFHLWVLTTNGEVLIKRVESRPTLTMDDLVQRFDSLEAFSNIVTQYWTTVKRCTEIRELYSYYTSENQLLQGNAIYLTPNDDDKMALLKTFDRHFVKHSCAVNSLDPQSNLREHQAELFFLEKFIQNVN